MLFLSLRPFCYLFRWSGGQMDCIPWGLKIGYHPNMLVYLLSLDFKKEHIYKLVFLLKLQRWDRARTSWLHWREWGLVDHSCGKKLRVRSTQVDHQERSERSDPDHGTDLEHGTKHNKTFFVASNAAIMARFWGTKWVRTFTNLHKKLAC